MPINRQVERREIEIVETFMYIGSNVNNDLSVENETKRQMNMVGNAFNRTKRTNFQKK